MPNKIPHITIPTSPDIESLRLSAERVLNRTIDQINLKNEVGDVNMNFHRINRLRPAISDDDAVSLKQLKEFLPNRKREESTGARQVRLNFVLLDAITVANDVTNHIEMAIDDNEIATPIAAFVNAKTAGTTSLILDVKYSYDICTTSTRTWATIFGTGTALPTLASGKDQLCAPHEIFAVSSFQQSTLFRCDVLNAAADDVKLVIVMDIS